MKKLAVLVALVGLSGVAQADAAQGAAVFSKRCVACHGKDGKGTTPMAQKLGVKDLTQSTMKLAEIEQIVADGKGKMTAFKGKLSEAELKDVSLFVANGLK